MVSTVPLKVVGSDYVNLEGTSLKFKLTHSGLNQPVTNNGITVYHAPTGILAGIDVATTVLTGMGV